MGMEQNGFLETLTWGGGAQRSLSLKTLPALTKIRALMLDVEVDLINNDAAADHTTNPLLHASIIDRIRVDKFKNFSGDDAFKAYAMKHGGSMELPAGVLVAKGGGVAHLHIAIPVEFWLQESPNPDECALPAELLRNIALQITFAPATLLGGAGTIMITGGSVNVSYEAVQTTPGWVPILTEEGTYDVNGHTIPMDAGAYIYAFLTQTDTTAFGAGVVTAAELTVDGQTAVQNMNAQSLVTRFNLKRLTRAPLAWLGAVLPILTQNKYTKVSQVPYAENGAAIQLQGTIVAPHLVYLRAVKKEPSDNSKIARATGIEPATAQYTIESDNGSVNSPADSEKGERALGLMAGRWRGKASREDQVTSGVDALRKS